jgi:hypothetical protein
MGTMTSRSSGRRPGAASVPRIVFVEIAGYVGAAAGVAGGLLLILRRGAEPDIVHVLALGALSAALVVAGAAVGGRNVDAYERMRSVLWFAAVVVFSAVVDSVFEVADVSPTSGARSFASSALALAMSLALWTFAKRSLQLVAVFLSALGVVGTILDLTIGDDGLDRTTGATVIWVFAIAWSVAVERLGLRPRTTGLVLGSLVALVVPTIAASGPSATPDTATGVAVWIFATAAAVLAAGAALRLRALSGLGIVGVLLSAVAVIAVNFSQTDAEVVAVVVAGIVLLVAASLGVRSSPVGKSTAPDVPPPPPTE